MEWIKGCLLSVALLLTATALPAQQSDQSGRSSDNPAIPGDRRPSLLEWTPPALAALGQQAETQNSFILDRTALGMMAAFSDEQIRPAIRKLDGISVHLYRFHDLGQINSAELEDVRAAYHALGWKHLVTGNRHVDSGHKTTDVWLSLDGMDVRGGAMMIVTPRTVSVVAFAGDLSPVDMLRLRGHFGIPAASGNDLNETK
jgi:hypothetical protein